jgi:hypothetical protein
LYGGLYVKNRPDRVLPPPPSTEESVSQTIEKRIKKMYTEENPGTDLAISVHMDK